MRFTSLYAGAALALGLSVCACSGGAPQALPGTSQLAAPTLRAAAHLVPIGFHADTGNYGGACPTSTSSYFYCYYISPGTTFSQQWEEEYPSGGEEPGTWHWRKSHVYDASTGAQTGKIRNNGWSPEPGNPSTQTITVSSAVPATGGAVGYYFNLNACSNNTPGQPKGYCDGPYEIGIVVLSPGS